MRDEMRRYKRSILTAVLILVGQVGCNVACYTLGDRNVEWVKAHAPAAANQLGFEIVGYEGYQYGMIFGGGVWYTMRRKGNGIKGNGITYQAMFARWGDEVHIYNLKAIDAIGGDR